VVRLASVGERILKTRIGKFGVEASKHGERPLIKYLTEDDLKTPEKFRNRYIPHPHETWREVQTLRTWIKLMMMDGDVESNPGPRNNNNKKKVNNKKNRRRPQRRRGTNIVPAERSALIMPPRHVASFLFIDGSYIRNNPGNNYLCYSFRINDLYDPDPLILTGSVSGFKEMMQFYNIYRVLSFSATINISNNETFDLLYGAVFSQVNLTSVIASRDDAINALENNYAKGPFILSAVGGVDRGSVSLRINPAVLLGDRRQYLADSDYSGIGLATPIKPLWLNFIVASPTGAALTNGYTSATKLFFRAEFFGRTNLRA
jgi:hypothetical protein